MPQIWLDAEELAAFTGLSAADARIHAIRQGWARMRCRNGTTNTRLPAELTREYLHALPQMEKRNATTISTWNALRRSLLALVPGTPQAGRGLALSPKQHAVSSRHGLVQVPLLTRADQSEAA